MLTPLSRSLVFTLSGMLSIECDPISRVKLAQLYGPTLKVTIPIEVSKTLAALLVGCKIKNNTPQLFRANREMQFYHKCY